MMIPTVHLNGTSREQLLEGYVSAITALDTALDKLLQTAPNGRDYYVQDGDAWRVANAEHLNRMRALHAVREELSQIAEHLI